MYIFPYYYTYTVKILSELLSSHILDTTMIPFPK